VIFGGFRDQLNYVPRFGLIQVDVEKARPGT
jgi:hypothetical protein